MNGLFPEFYLISASCAHFRTDDNLVRTQSLKTELELCGLPFKGVAGMYNNVPEASFMVPTSNRELILDLAKKFDQRCVLHVDKNREAAMVYVSGLKDQYQGKWKSIQDVEAASIGNYTKDGEYYYTTRRIL